MPIDADFEIDEQDQAEVFDETNNTEDGGDIAHLDMARNVFDATSAEDDGGLDGDLADEDPDDFDPDQLDESELEQMLEEDDGIDAESESPGDRSDLVASDDASTADFEGGGDDDDDADEADKPDSGAGTRPDKRRDYEVEESFPASDPPPANPGAD